VSIDRRLPLRSAGQHRLAAATGRRVAAATARTLPSVGGPLAVGPRQRRSAHAGRCKLLDDDDDLAFGVPFAEIPQRLGHLTQPIPTVDNCSDLSRLAEINDRRQVLRT